MLNTKVIGVGFGGSKGCIRAIENEAINREDAMIINSTLKDIPLDYEDIAAYYSRAYGGSAKERSSAKELCLDALKNDEQFKKKIHAFINPNTEVVIFVVAVEGGTGSGSVPILAKYFDTVIRKANPKLKIHIFALNGFELDSRGLQNTVEFFQELGKSYTVQSISMKKFVEDEGLTASQAEDKADSVFAEKLAIAMGKNINYENSRHNIDESDLIKLSTTPGFMRTWRISFNKLKNAEAFNKLLTDAIDNDKSLDIPKQSITRFGIITNISEATESMIDLKFPIVRNKLGNYFDIFIHDNAYTDKDEYIEFIAAGMKMPIDELKAVYDKYLKETQSIDKDDDDFFSIMNGFKGDFNDTMFDFGANKKELDTPKEIDLKDAEDDFFSEFMPAEKEVATDTKVSGKPNVENY